MFGMLVHLDSVKSSTLRVLAVLTILVKDAFDYQVNLKYDAITLHFVFWSTAFQLLLLNNLLVNGKLLVLTTEMLSLAQDSLSSMSMLINLANIGRLLSSKIDHEHVKLLSYSSG